MAERSAKEMVIGCLDELKNAEEAMLIIVHNDGTISWHETTGKITSNLGLVSYVKVCLEDEIRMTSEIGKSPAPKELIN
jgi:deoxyxylulose-5-phosphate synthase